MPTPTNEDLDARAEALVEDHFRRTGRALSKSEALERIITGGPVETLDELGVRTDAIQAEQRRRGVFMRRSEALERAIAESGRVRT